MSAAKLKPAASGRYISLYLPGPLYSRYEREAKARKTTVGKVVKERLEHEDLTVFDLMGNLIGSGQGGPSDLSTNLEYFADFGSDVVPAKAPRK